jgi:hypothetical protein
MDIGQVAGRLARRTVAFNRSKLDLGTGVRCGIGMAIPLAIGLATGHPSGGAYAAAGALLTAFAGFVPSPRHRATIMLGIAAALAVNTLIAGTVGSWTWVVVVLAGLLAFGSGLLGALGPGAALIAILGTIEFLISSSAPVGTTTALIHAAQVGAGGLVETLVAAGPWARRTDPERQALAAAYNNLSAYALALPQGRPALADAQAIEDLRATFAASSRQARWGQGRALQSLADAAERIRRSLEALAVARDHLAGSPVRGTATAGRGTPGTGGGGGGAQQAVADQAVTSLDQVACSTGSLLEVIAAAIRDNRPPPSGTESHAAIDRATAALEELAGENGPGRTSPIRPVAVGHDVLLVRALHGQLRSVQGLVTASTVTARDRRAVPATLAGPSAATLARTEVRLLRANLTFASTAFRHALRLAVAVTVATALYRTLPGSHEYWIGIAALMVLKPDFDTTITRGLGRAAGAVTGAVLATIVAAELRPGPVALAALISVLAVVVFTVRQTNYGLYTLAWTPLVVFFAAFGGLPPLTAATDRAVDNLIGIALALAIFFVWPTWAATAVPSLLARLLVTQEMFARMVLDAEIDPAALDQRALDQAGSAARVARTNAEAAVERMATEPDRPGALTTAAADGIVASVHRFALAVVAVHAGQPASHPPVAQLIPLRDGITTTMTGLAERLSGQAGSARPNLRALHAELIHGLHEAVSRDQPPGIRAFSAEMAFVVGETDLMVDSVDTMAELLTAPQADQRHAAGHVF